MAKAVRFKNTDVPRQSNELARLKVVGGPDQGAIYIVQSDKVSIGRGEENDIILSDLKASRVHAVLQKKPQGWIIKDQGSANGINVNGSNTREANLGMNDSIALGETTFQFFTASANTAILTAPGRSAQSISLELQKQQVQQDRIKSVRNGASVGMGSNKMNPKNMLLIGVTALGLFLFFGLDSKPKASLSEKKSLDASQAPNLASFLPPAGQNKTAETVFKDGLREYFSGNYNRARTQFETVLQISPGHALATLYLENCNTAVKDEVSKHLEYANKALKAGKLRESRMHFDRVLKLLYRDQSNSAYIEAKEQFEKVTKTMDLPVGGP